MSEIQLHDRRFKVSILRRDIEEAVKHLASRIDDELAHKKPLFVCVLNGAFMFASDLLKHLSIDCEITFVKLASYEGTLSSGTVKTIIGLDRRIKRRTVVVLEDIVDSGLTMQTIMHQLRDLGPAEVLSCSFLFKPDALEKDIRLDYVALEIPNDFIVGYGLDYDGLGRNLPDIYTVVD